MTGLEVTGLIAIGTLITLVGFVLGIALGVHLVNDSRDVDHIKEGEWMWTCFAEGCTSKPVKSKNFDVLADLARIHRMNHHPDAVEPVETTVIITNETKDRDA